MKETQVVIKDFNTFMYNHTSHRQKKNFSRYCLQAFITEEILKDCFKINCKQRIIMPKKGKDIKFKKL